MPENTLNTRIQLKMDTETSWNASALVADGGTKQSGNSFIPKRGELIIYSVDNTHAFCRLKVGDNVHSVPQLPFIDAGSVNSLIISEVIQVYDELDDFPLVGASYSLYVDKETSKLYYWSTDDEEYVYIGPPELNLTNITIDAVDTWNAGTAANMYMDGYILTLIPGVAPALTTAETTVLQQQQQGV